MIQIIGYRDYYNNQDKIWDVSQKLMLTTDYDNVGTMIQNLNKVLEKIPSEEHYNLHYTTANCFEAPRQFKSQTLIPVDIDDITEENLDAHIAVISHAINISEDNFIQVSSGHGLHLLFEVDHVIGSIEELRELKKSYGIFCDVIQNALKNAELSGKVDKQVFRQSGTLRLPGTINRCLKKTALTYDDTNCTILSSSYVVQSFANILGEVATAEAGESIDSSSIRAFPLPDTEYIIKECKFLDWNFTSPAEVSEPEWYAALSIIGYLENGGMLAHKMSGGHPQYTHANTESKLAQAISASGPRTCQNIDMLSDKCRTCPHFGKITSPILLKGPGYIKTAGSGFWDIGPDKNGNPKPIKPNYEDLRRYFEKKYQYVSTTSRQVWIYETPVWKEYKKSFLEEFAQNNFSPRPSSAHVQEFTNLILRSNVVTDSWFDEKSENKVNLSNGVLDMITLEFSGHDKKFGFKHVLNHEYSPGSDCPRFDKFMEEVTVGRHSLQSVLMEFMAYSISGMPYIHHKALVLSGEGSNGKSVFLSVLKKLVGHTSYSSLLMTQFESDYHRSMMVGKLFNVAEETPSRRSDSSFFKILSSGGSYLAREPYGRPIQVESNRTKLIMACNELPEMSDFSGGFARRLLIVPFDATFTKKTADVKIEDKLTQELPGIFNKIIKSYQTLVANGRFTESEVVEKAVDEYRTSQNSLVSFIDSEMIFTDKDEDEVSCKEFFVEYIRYCRDVGIYAVSPNRAGRDLSRFFNIKSRISKMEGSNTRKYPKLKFKKSPGF